MSKTHENIESILKIVTDIQTQVTALTSAHAATSATVDTHAAQLQAIATGVIAIADQVTPTT